MADRILIIHSGGIGDLLLALPAMRIFREGFPRSTLGLLGRPERLALVAHDLGATSVCSIDQSGMAYFYSEGSALPAGLSAFFSSFRVALVFGKSSGVVLAGNLKKLGVGVISVPSFPLEASGVHVSDYLIESLREKGFEGEKNITPLAIPEASLSLGRKFWASQGLKDGERTLAIHPGSGSPAKNWHPKNFAEIADWASRKTKVLLILGPAEEGMPEVKASLKQAGTAIADQLPLVHLAGVLRSCSAYVGNDSGITHLAVALGVPTIAIFGSTNPAVWAPWGERVKVISGKDAGSPGRSSAAAKTFPAGLEKVDANRVIRALDSFLG